MKVSISGNSAYYSIPKAKKVLCVATPEEASTAFKHLSYVQFNPDGTVSIHHDGEMTTDVRKDMRKLGQVLATGEELVAIGMDYTNQQAFIVSVSKFGVELLPVIIKPTTEDGFRRRDFIQQLSKVIALDATWYKPGPRRDLRLPHSLEAVAPHSDGYDLFESNAE